MPSWLHFPSWGDIAAWIQARIGLGGPGLAGSGVIGSAISSAKAIKNVATNAYNTASSFVSSIFNRSGPREDSLDNMFSGFRYEPYEGSRKSISQTLDDMSGNCVDGTLAQLYMAGQMGIRAGADFTTWNSHPHMLAVVENRPRDVANHALTGSWNRPPAGPGSDLSGVYFGDGAIRIEGSFIGMEQYKNQIADVARQTFDEVARKRNLYRNGG
jgi:hypothetical protein